MASVYFTPSCLSTAIFGVTSACALIGMICNSLIVITTVKTKTMRTTCNVLIAICAIADVFHQAGTLNYELPLLLNIAGEIEQFHCTLLMFLPTIGIGIGCAGMLCIGLDRLLSIQFSLRYRALNSLYYHSFYAAVIIGYCVYLFCIMAIFYRERRVLCNVIATFPDAGFEWFSRANLVMNVANLLVYLTIWIGLRSKADSSVMTRIVRSLLTIMVVDVGGWMLTPIFLNVIGSLDLERPFANIPC